MVYNKTLDKHLLKTRICNYYINCNCIYDIKQCCFAHGFCDFNYQRDYSNHKFIEEFNRINDMLFELINEYNILSSLLIIYYTQYINLSMYNYINKIYIKRLYICEKMRHLINITCMSL